MEWNSEAADSLAAIQSLVFQAGEDLFEGVVAQADVARHFIGHPAEQIPFLV